MTYSMMNNLNAQVQNKSFMSKCNENDAIVDHFNCKLDIFTVTYNVIFKNLATVTINYYDLQVQNVFLCQNGIKSDDVTVDHFKNSSIHHKRTNAHFINIFHSE